MLNSYAAYTKNSIIRENSSSGGVFSEIAEYVLSKGGTVYGAAYNNELLIRHVRIDNINDLKILRGSKYAESRFADILDSIENDLNNKTLVLFTGTPCQSYAVKKKFMKFENLICLDFICHGIPSESVWKRYLDCYKDKGITLSSINMRNKSNGWKNYCWKIDGNISDIIQWKKVPYMQGFIQNLTIRQSCLDCKCKGINRITDITLGDFWGIDRIFPEMDDDKGISAVIINTHKGQTIFDSVKDNIIYRKSDINDISKYNSSLVKSAVPHKKRKEFFDNYMEKDIDTLIIKCLKVSKMTRIKKKCKKVLGRLFHVK